MPGHVAQSRMCLTADPGEVSSILAQSHAFVEIYHEIISMAIFPSQSWILAQSRIFEEIYHEIIYTAFFPSADLRRVVVSYRPTYVHEALVNCLVKIAQEKSVVR